MKMLTSTVTFALSLFVVFTLYGYADTLSSGGLTRTICTLTASDSCSK